MPPLDLYDVGFVGVAGASASDYPDGLGDLADLDITGSGVLYQQSGGGSETYSIRFQGVGNTGIGEYSLASSIDLSSAFTVSFWANNQVFALPGSTSSAFGVRVTSGTGILGALRSTLYKDIRSEGGHGDLLTGVVALDTWYHVVITFDGSNSAIWLGEAGADDMAQDATSSGSMTNMNGFHLGLSGADPGTFPSNALFSQFLIYSRELSDAEIGNLYNGGSGASPTTIDTTGLRVYYDFSASGTPIINQAIP